MQSYIYFDLFGCVRFQGLTLLFAGKNFFWRILDNLKNLHLAQGKLQSPLLEGRQQLAYLYPKKILAHSQVCRHTLLAATSV